MPSNCCRMSLFVTISTKLKEFLQCHPCSTLAAVQQYNNAQQCIAFYNLINHFMQQYFLPALLSLHFGLWWLDDILLVFIHWKSTFQELVETCWLLLIFWQIYLLPFASLVVVHRWWWCIKKEPKGGREALSCKCLWVEFHGSKWMLCQIILNEIFYEVSDWPSSHVVLMFNQIGPYTWCLYYSS